MARSMTAGVVLRRGLLAGLAAGLGAGVFLFVVGEPSITQALRYEVVPPGEASVEVLSRTTQRLGLLAATGLYGVALGGVFALVAALLGPRLRAVSAWERSLRLAAAAFVALWLVPFLKYPSNPPAVGDPATIGLRSRLYLTMVAVSVAAMAAAWLASRWLTARGVDPAVRQLLVAGGYLLVVAVAFWLLPANPDPILVPAKVVWNARLASVAGQALLWALLGAGYGLLELRSERQATQGLVGQAAPIRG
jgi:hypothetical protein